MNPRLTHDEMLALARKNPPPQSWFEEDFTKVRGDEKVTRLHPPESEVPVLDLGSLAHRR